MQKKIIALAIAAAFSAPAFADNANITFYGKVFLNGESVKNDKIVAPNKDNAMRINSNASRFGLKGSEDLGNDLKGIYQYEVEMDANGNGLSTGPTGSTTTVGGFAKTRNSGVGIEGGFGKVIVGIWDTPFKVAHNKIELFDNTSSFTSLNLLGRAGASADYNTRQKNMVQYWSPSFSGLQAAVSYSPDAAPTTTVNKSLLSMAATYDVDAVYAAVAYETRADATTAGTNDSGLRAVGRYHLGDFWVGATFESIKVNTSATASYSQKNVELVGQYKLGANKFAASYAKAGSTATTLTGANQLTLRYGYDFTKRTEAFVAYTSLKNDTAGGYGLAFAKFQPTGSVTGSTQTVVGAGIVHSF